jgi:hypothetical protein
MSTFRLSLPTDIPWRRICVSRDMLDPIPCDAQRPPRWQSSLAAFRYDPPDEYQPYEDQLVSYVKVVATVVPYAPEVDIAVGEYVPPQLVDELEEAFPCYGALLHVTVTPTAADRPRYPVERYPFFLEFEPKKRELYELVTDTGEVLSGSQARLTVGKSATNTSSLENYNLDNGWNFGMQGSYAGTGGGVTVGQPETVGQIGRQGQEYTNIRTTDLATERREVQSHTTQLSQMYNMFQAFHLGTNRAMFFMEPRPHIRQSEATFVNGPRALEGIQEVFLVVARPRDMTEFCIGGVLETAHLTKQPVYETPQTTDTLAFRLHGTAENKDTDWGSTDWWEPVEKTETYTPPPDWEIDTSQGMGGYSYRLLSQQNVIQGPVFNVSPGSLTVYGKVQWHFWETGITHSDNYQDGFLNVDVTIYLRKREPDFVDYVRKLFLSARSLCCCAGEEPPVLRRPDWITGVVDLTRKHWRIYTGLANRRSFLESRSIAAEIHAQMVRMQGSSRRIPHGEVAYTRSDAFLTRVADVLRAHKRRTVLDARLAEAPIEDPMFERVAQVMGEATVGDLIAVESEILAETAGIEIADVLALKDRLLAAARRPSGPIVRGPDSGGGGPDDTPTIPGRKC